MSSTNATVLVSGASGFIALHVVGQLLSKGYAVIGTIRSQSKADALHKRFAAKLGSKADKLSFAVVEDIATEGAFDKVFQDHKEIKYVLHTASPFSYGIDDLEAGYLKPAVDGTVGVLSSIKKYAPQVEKVVVTSSFASIVNVSKLGDPSFVHTEETWNPIEWEHVTDDKVAYMASKKLAERAAWDYVKENDVKFTLNTVCPPFVLGPQYFDEDAGAEKLNTSNQMIKELLSTATPQFGEFILGSVDVRDVAAFHILALEKDIGGERLFPFCKNPYSDAYALKVLNDNFPQLKGKIGETPSKERIEKDLNAAPNCDNSKSVKLVGGYEFTGLDKIVVDIAQQILDQA